MILKNNRSLLLYLLVIFVINVFFLFFPLINIFGFEFSIANSILLFLISGVYSINFFKKRNGFNHFQLSEIEKIGQEFLCFLIVPIIVSVVYSFFNIICSLKDGFLFYLIITAPSVVLGFATGLLTYIYFRRFSVIAFIIITILIMIIPLFEFYFNPQIFFFNPVFGFFPGTIYDEGIKVSIKLILYRCFNLVFFAGAVYIVLKATKIKYSKIIIGLYAIVIPLLFIYFSPAFGFSITNSKLQGILRKNFETTHFNIYYSRDIPDNLARKIALEHEYDYEILSNLFKVHPNRKITSYIFNSNEQKGSIFGSRNADIAKPWLSQIYISADSYNETLRHELAHVFTAAFGTGLFKVADGLNPALIEGAAVAGAPYYDDNTIHYMAALAYKNNYKIKIAHLFTGLNFFSSVSSLSYIYAGSFSKYLIDKYGIKKFENLYSNLNFHDVYDESVESIANGYYDFLDSLKIVNNANEANYYFGRQTIFQKVCPRYIGERLETARNYFSQRNYSEAKNIFNEILQKSTNYSALIGFSSTLVEENKPGEAANTIANNINKFSHTAYYFNLELRLADLEILNSNISYADSLYQKIFSQNPNRVLYNLADLRVQLSKDSAFIKQYVRGDDYQKFEILIKLDSVKYVYSTIPVLIELAQSTNIDYNVTMLNFQNELKVDNYGSSYAMYILSQYMMDNLDFKNARAIAELAKSYKSDDNYNDILKSNFEKANWFYNNFDRIIKNTKFNQ